MVVIAAVIVGRALLRDSGLLSVFTSHGTIGLFKESVGDAYDGTSRGMQNILSVFSALAKRSLAGVYSLLSRALRRSERKSAFSIANWTACKLVRVEELDAEHNRYRFEFPGSLEERVVVDVGQQVRLPSGGAPFICTNPP
jgi:hypothetical protein